MPWLEMVVGAGLAFFVIFLFQQRNNRPRVEMPRPGQGSMEDVHRLTREGHKIAAIKVYREVHGVGLREAKAAVEALTP